MDPDLVDHLWAPLGRDHRGVGGSWFFALADVGKVATATVAFASAVASRALAATKAGEKRRANRTARTEAENLLLDLRKTGANGDRAIDRLKAINNKQSREVSGTEDVTVDDIRAAMQNIIDEDTRPLKGDNRGKGKAPDGAGAGGDGAAGNANGGT